MQPLFRPISAQNSRPAPFLPMTRAEMDALGWECCDVILVTGDAYIDHPSFGMALIGRLLEAQGFRVGIISQPDWQTADSFKVLGKPRLYFGVTAGNMDSMVNHYTSDRKIRSDDAYTAGGIAGKRPDRAVIVYAQRCREAFSDVPIVIGGIEASLRRIAHFDYWSDTIRRSVLVDSKADILLYGNAERALIDLTFLLNEGTKINDIQDLRGTVVIKKQIPEDFTEVFEHTPKIERTKTVMRLPSFEEVKINQTLYAQASRILHLESNPHNARALVQKHGNREVWLNPPPFPLTTTELDQVYDLNYARLPHPSYQNQKIPAFEMIRFSINIMRGCFGGCTFCSITEHEGRIIQSRSEQSILKEIQRIQEVGKGFTGVISDLGGPTANMYRLGCKDHNIEKHCRKLSCVYPTICQNLNTNHKPLIEIYKKAREIKGIKKITIGSGVRYDLAVESPEYIKELVTHHVGGYLKIAPEHTEDNVLSKMMKPSISVYDKFKQLFEKYSKAAGKEQYLIPYFIAAHPGATTQDMLNLALWLKKNNFRLDQVQAYLPSPMAIATAMYHSGKNPLHLVNEKSEQVYTAKGLKLRRLHKAFLRYHDPANWSLLRDALRQMGRADLIGNGKHHLIPNYQPALSPQQQPEGARFKNTPISSRIDRSWTAGSPSGHGKRRGGKK
jgi:uncharacterized radical SAM protein YgiQ